MLKRCVSLLMTLDALGKAADNGCAEFNSSAEIGVSIHKADKPRLSGIFTSVTTTEASFMAGRSGGYLGSVGFFVADTPTPLRTCHPQLALSGGLLKPTKEAFIMPKHARTFFTYSLVAITTLAIERNTPITVIALSLAALVLVNVIGGANRVK